MITVKTNKKFSGIFLMFGGLPSTIMESQVFLNVAAINSDLVLMEVWSYATTKESYLDAKQKVDKLSEKYKIQIRVLRGLSPGVPFSPYVNALLLLYSLLHNRLYPRFINARTEYASVVAILLKIVFNVRVIWDSRGDTLSEYQFIKKRDTFFNSLIYPLGLALLRWRLNFVVRNCDAAIFVSNALMNLQWKKNSKNRAYVIPCLADENLFYYSNELRALTRKSLGYLDDDIVLIYVGSLAPWQCVEETIGMMQDAMHRSIKVKCLIITTEVTKFKSLFSASDESKVSVIESNLSGVNAYLNASDYSFLLRQNNSINSVASPVKFAEYSLSGLLVVTTKAVDQVNQFGAVLRNTISPEIFITGIDRFRHANEIRQKISTNATVILSRGSSRIQSTVLDIYLGN